MRVLVAMSGGIDSSVVACLLKEQGHEVIGTHFHLWQDPKAPALATLLPSKCCTAQSFARVRKVAKNLNIPLHILDLQKEFKKEVVDPFIAAYKKGLTPNPCILCNRHFKFDRLLTLADKLYCTHVATGHYARILTRRRGNISYSALLEASDKKKDQSYFLYRLTQKELKRTLLPLGNITKKKVFSLAEKFQIPLNRSSYRESQDLCFFPEKSPDAFLHRYLKGVKAGVILSKDGVTLGMHEGLPFYTIGQRRGLHVGGQMIPLYVLKKEHKSNALIIAPLRDLRDNKVLIRSCTFTRGKLVHSSRFSLSARIRSQGKKMKGMLRKRSRDFLFTTTKPMMSITPGQSLVLYQGNEVLGGGIIET
ncbi:MAG: tRNA 2-thiouridine(34) synthase MnmA [Candidatus Peregrinibacteria bacterium]